MQYRDFSLVKLTLSYPIMVNRFSSTELSIFLKSGKFLGFFYAVHICFFVSTFAFSIWHIVSAGWAELLRQRINNYRK